MALFLGGGVAAGALAGYLLGPKRGPVFLGWVVIRAALVTLVVFVSASFFASEVLYLAARASFLAVLGFFSGGLAQTLGMAVSEGGRRRRGHWWALVLGSLLWLVLLTVAGLLWRGVF